MGLWVLLQVPLCKEGLVGTGRATRYTASRPQLCTLAVHQSRGESQAHPVCVKQTHPRGPTLPSTPG